MVINRSLKHPTSVVSLNKATIKKINVNNQSINSKGAGSGGQRTKIKAATSIDFNYLVGSQQYNPVLTTEQVAHEVINDQQLLQNPN